MKRMSHGHGPLFDVTPNKNLLDNAFKQKQYYTAILLDAKGPRTESYIYQPSGFLGSYASVTGGKGQLDIRRRHTDSGANLPAP